MRRLAHTWMVAIVPNRLSCSPLPLLACKAAHKAPYRTNAIPRPATFDAIVTGLEKLDQVD